jgi:glycosyltransferase involved in cell wall biosynthesis
VLGDDALLVPVGDSEAVADALATLVAHRHLCRELGARARARAERDFSPEAVVESLWSRLATPS